MARCDALAICALSCRLPGAAAPEALYELALHGRRAFRSIPPARLDLAAYAAGTAAGADAITPVQAGLLADWTFDREAWKVSKGTFDNTDLAHWLALEQAARTLEAAGGADTLDRERTAVVVANSLTGEFSRATQLRLRGPFLDGLLAEALAEAAIGDTQAARARRHFIEALNARFAEPNEDMLAGGLANTIAGRIANRFDLTGGAYTVDGACASSLLAVANAAALLETDAAEAVLVGAVDLSLDPFELVGFSRNDALASQRMLVFDARSAGFWPGEGSAFALLTRASVAARKGWRPRALLRGWAMSTDGAGGLTRPLAEGQLRAYRAAHARAGTEPADLAFVEAHGTGTRVGDRAEITSLAALRPAGTPVLPIGSIKANIGHTKAAAGFAGLIKAALSLERGLVPPHAGCEIPNPAFAETEHRLHAPDRAVPLDDGAAIAGVSSFGFGGINVHLVLERAVRPTGRTVSPAMPAQPLAPQDVELFAFSAPTQGDLAARLDALVEAAPSLSTAELTDLAADLGQAVNHGAWRAAIVAADGAELAAKLRAARDALRDGPADTAPAGIHLNRRPRQAPRIGFLFPGQAAPVRRAEGIWARRFPAALHDAVAAEALSGVQAGATDTRQAQPAICAATLTGCRVLAEFGVHGLAAGGHSVGEIAGLAWAGALSFADALAVVNRRGAAIADHCTESGAMLRLRAPVELATRLAERHGCVLACLNGAREVVVSGPVSGIERLAAAAAANGVEALRLPVSHAFHGPLIAPAAAPFEAVLDDTPMDRVSAHLVSTVLGRAYGPGDDVRATLVAQLTAPVRFADALNELAAATDVLIEVGAGQGTARLARDAGLAAHAIDVFGDSLRPLLETLGALYVAGCEVALDRLYSDRDVRPIDASRPRQLLSNPCGRSAPGATPAPRPEPRSRETARPRTVPASAGSPVEAVRRALAAEMDLPYEAIDPDARFLSDLQLNSLATLRVLSVAAQSVGAPPIVNPGALVDASANQVAKAIDQGPGHCVTTDRGPNGAAPWIGHYEMAWEAADPVPGLGVAEATSRHLIEVRQPFDEAAAVALLHDLQRAAAERVAAIAVLHDGAPVGGMLRSVFEERHFESCLVLDKNGRADDDPRIVEQLAAVPAGYREIRLAGGGRVERPVFRPAVPARHPTGLPGPDDVVLAVGCVEGIGSTCLRALAHDGARLVVVGRRPAADPGVVAALARLGQSSASVAYRACDVSDRDAVAALADDLGACGLAPTVLLFAPAVNEPAPLGRISADMLRATLRPKASGLDAVLSAFGAGLSQVIAFGSIIGVIGLQGEAHYALANAMQTARLQAFARAHPDVRCLSVEWSVWSQGGMAERLGVVEHLAASGVVALEENGACEAFRSLLAVGASGSLVVTGRFGHPASLDIGSTALPGRRFLDTPVLDYPGQELIVETRLSAGRDPYLAEHVVDGRPILPGVIGLEAMAEVAGCLAREATPLSMQGVEFVRPVGVEGPSLAIRIAAARTTPGRIDTALFCEEDDHAQPRMRATLDAAHVVIPAPPTAVTAAGVTSASGLYGPLFFHSGRFARIRRITSLSSRMVAAELADAGAPLWFGPYDHGATVHLDPGAADAMLHALMATLPHKRLLPVGVDRIVANPDAGAVVGVVAQETFARAPDYGFDIWGLAADGTPALWMREARFRAVAERDPTAAIEAEPALVPVWVERVVRETFGDDGAVATVIHDAAMDAPVRANQADGVLRARGEVAGHRLHIAHAGALTLAVRTRARLGCELREDRVAVPGLATRQVRQETCLPFRLAGKSYVARLTRAGGTDGRPDLPESRVVALP